MKPVLPGFMPPTQNLAVTGRKRKMTEQYQRQTINIDTDFRRVDQDDIDTTLTVPAVVLGPDDRFVLCGEAAGNTTAYRVNMPLVSVAPSPLYVLKAPTGNTASVTIGGAEIGGVANLQTFDAVLSPLGTALAPGFSAEFSPDMPLKPVAPAVLPVASINWSIIKLPAAP